jgi:hypothetical protein
VGMQHRRKRCIQKSYLKYHLGELGIDWIILKLKKQNEVMVWIQLDQDRA